MGDGAHGPGGGESALCDIKIIGQQKGRAMLPCSVDDSFFNLILYAVKRNNKSIYIKAHTLCKYFSFMCDMHEQNAAGIYMGGGVA